MTDISQTQLSRAHNNLKFWLKIKTAEVDPILFLERPIVHLAQLFANHNSSTPLGAISAQAPSPPLSGSKKKTWSKSNLAYMRSLDLAHVRRLATSLLAFGADLKIAVRRVPEGVAAAAVVVAMEGVARRPLPAANEFMDELAFLMGLKPFTVAERYREFNKVLSDFAPRLPWLALDSHSGGGNKSDTKRKAELVKYTDDIVQFRANLDAQALRDDAARRQAKPSLGYIEDSSQPDLTAARPAPDQHWTSGDHGDDDEEEDAVVDDILPDPLKDREAARALLDLTGLKGAVRFTRDHASAAPHSPAPLPALVSPGQSAATLLTNGSGLNQEDGRLKRPLEPGRSKTAGSKRVKTISQAAHTLVNSLSGPSTRSETPPSASPAPESNTESLSKDPAQVVDNTPSDGSPFVGYRQGKVDGRSATYAQHSLEAVRFRQLLLEGHDVETILDKGPAKLETGGPTPVGDSVEGSVTLSGSGSTLVSAAGNARHRRGSRLEKLLWLKSIDELDDDELFDEGELESFVRDPEEVDKLKKLPRFATMENNLGYVDPNSARGRAPKRRRKKHGPFQFVPPDPEALDGEKDTGPNLGQQRKSRIDATGTQVDAGDDEDPDGFKRKRKSKIDRSLANKIEEILLGLDGSGEENSESDDDDDEGAEELGRMVASATAQAAVAAGASASEGEDQESEEEEEDDD